MIDMQSFQIQAFATERGVEVDLYRGKLRMGLSYWDSLFTPTIERVKAHVVQLLSQPEAQDCKSVLLVRCTSCVCVAVWCNSHTDSSSVSMSHCWGVRLF